MSKKVLIVGGVAGGASAAARLRRLDEAAEIIMFERDEHISFANCGLPYYLGGVIENRENLFIQTPEKFFAEFNIEVRIFSEVTAVNPSAKSVSVVKRDGGAYEESYDYLMLSPGAKPLKPPIPGLEFSNIVTLRNVADTDAIHQRLSGGVQRVTVIGGGFIGVEMAENARHRGLAVTLVEAVPHILAPFDTDMAVLLERELEEQGVRLILGDGVKAFHGRADGGVSVELASGRQVESDLVILAIGVAPDTAFLKESGLELGPKGHIAVDEHMRTSDPCIYAAGDAAEIVDFVNGRKTAVPLAGPANLQGRIAADNIAGRDSVYRGAVGASVIKVFDLTAAAVGSNERLLKQLGRACQVAYAHPQSHASYYPGATPMSLKLIYDGDGLILGAQGIGQEGVDKSIDVIATAIKLKGRVSDLTHLELCYAPPFSSAKAPVNMVAYVAENSLAGLFNPITYDEYQELDRAALTVVDVRSPLEYEVGHLEGALSIPLEELRRRMNELEREKPVIVYCKIGRRSYEAARILMQHGFQVRSLLGGYTTAASRNFKPGEGEARPTAAPAAAEAQGNTSAPPFDEQLDASGLSCPGPLIKLKAAMEAMSPGRVLKITASDPGFFADVAAWSAATKNQLLFREKGRLITAFVKKSAGAAAPAQPRPDAVGSDAKTIVLFSNDLDKVLASLIIANGALAMNKKVTVFFTFWGLSVLRKEAGESGPKNFMEKMFAFMLPRGVGRLGLSKMNMGGLGATMMRGLMAKKGVPTVAELLENLQSGGAELVACQMSMDIMGFKREELIGGLSFGGVGAYLGRTDEANTNLFI